VDAAKRNPDPWKNTANSPAIDDLMSLFDFSGAGYLQIE
jgi:hypothetical protein